MTSTMPGALATAQQVAKATGARLEPSPSLNPIDKGTVGTAWWEMDSDGDMPPWAELERCYPEFFSELAKDPWGCRFPHGESYSDVRSRLDAALLDAEMCTRPVLIVSHITTLQLLIAYFRGEPVQNAWKVQVPNRTVIELTPTLGGGFQWTEHELMPQPAARGG
mmetsp:Transcript_131498/g.340534  ORF Transcript_131498/g.340534 Transcript_131498/m.340534 type:complete len:165 (-) Transcript_131498:205-699(-)